MANGLELEEKEIRTWGYVKEYMAERKVLFREKREKNIERKKRKKETAIERKTPC